MGSEMCIRDRSERTSTVTMSGAGEGANAALIYNRRLFLAGVVRTTGGTQVYNGDRIYFSEPGKFDIIPDYNYIDVVIGDSDEYVQLAGFAGRLLAFKRNSLQIIDITNADATQWKLVSNIKPSGVLYPYHVVQTKYGIVWLNSSGLFLYDGKSIKNLILGKLKQESIVGYVSDTTVLFYDTNYDVVIVNGASQSLIYSFLTDSFSTAGSYGLTSNPVTSYDGDTLLLVSSGSDAVLKRYSHTTTSKTYTLTTKTFDFGTTSLYKKVYSITITYTLSGGTAAVYYNIGAVSYTHLTLPTN